MQRLQGHKQRVQMACNGVQGQSKRFKVTGNSGIGAICLCWIGFRNGIARLLNLMYIYESAGGGCINNP